MLTHGLHYASSVFEGERMYSGRIYKLEEHTARLFESARILGMEIPYTEQQISDASTEVCRAMSFDNAYIRPVVFRGSEQMSVAAPELPTSTSRSRRGNGARYFDPAEKMEGIRLTLSRWKRPAPDTAPTKSKAAGLYMICTVSKHEADRDGFDDAIMYRLSRLYRRSDRRQRVLRAGRHADHADADCFLDGITRRSVMALARARQIPVIERHIKPEEMSGFTECFLTGTAAEVTPVQSIGEYKFKPGKITETLMTDYMADVNRPVSSITLAAAE